MQTNICYSISPFTSLQGIGIISPPPVLAVSPPKNRLSGKYKLTSHRVFFFLCGVDGVFRSVSSASSASLEVPSSSHISSSSVDVIMGGFPITDQS